MISLGVNGTLQIPLENILGKFIAILGIRGSGKTHTCGVITEQLLEKNVTVALIDPEGEYFGLRTKYEILVVGESGNVDVHVPVEGAAEIARMSMQDNIPMVIDLSGFDEDDMYAFFKEYITEVWKMSSHLRRVYQLVFDEAHLWVPQGGKSPVKKIMRNVALRGRKRGLGSIVVGQRSSNIDKDFLTQAEYYFLHKVMHRADLDVYRTFLPIDNIVDQVRNLEPGECFYVDGGDVTKVKIQPRKSYHVSVTPTLTPTQPPPLKEVNESIVKAIRAIATRVKKEDDKILFLEGKIKDLEKQLDDAYNYISTLEQTIHTLRTIEVKMTPVPLDIEEISERVAQKIVNHRSTFSREENVVQEVNETQDKDHDVTKGNGKNDSGILEVIAENPVSLEDEQKCAEVSSQFVLFTDEEAPSDKKHLFSGGDEKPNSTPMDVSDEELPVRVRNTLREIIERIESLPPLQKRVLAFLSNAEPRGFTTREMSSFLDYQEGSLKTVLPSSKIARWGMIDREKVDREFVYRATIKEFTEKFFGGQAETPLMVKAIESRLRDEINNICRLI